MTDTFLSDINSKADLLLDAIGKERIDDELTVRTVPDTIAISSSPYRFHEYETAALTYEVGDNFTRAFVKMKAEVAAVKLIEIMLK